MSGLVMELLAGWTDDSRPPGWQGSRLASPLRAPGVQTATQYRTIMGPPETMVAYELNDVSVVASQAWRAMDQQAPDERHPHHDSTSEPRDRRLYRLSTEFYNGPWDLQQVHAAIAVWLTVDDSDDLAAWYAQEHIPLLFRSPGWLRVRRFELVSGGGPRWLALHDLQSRDTIDDSRASAARDTEWRSHIMANRTAFERRAYRLHRRIPAEMDELHAGA